MPPVQWTETVFDSRKATATLRWSRFVGPRFKAYHIERRADNGVAETVATVSNVEDTSYVDGELRGNTEYTYRIVAVTDAGEEVGSEERSGAFHRLVASWEVATPVVSNVWGCDAVHFMLMP